MTVKSPSQAQMKSLHAGSVTAWLGTGPTSTATARPAITSPSFPSLIVPLRFGSRNPRLDVFCIQRGGEQEACLLGGPFFSAFWGSATYPQARNVRILDTRPTEPRPTPLPDRDGPSSTVYANPPCESGALVSASPSWASQSPCSSRAALRTRRSESNSTSSAAPAICRIAS